MVDFNGIRSFLFDLKCTKIVGGSAPDPSRVAHHVLHTAGEDGVKDEFASDLNFLAKPLW